MEHYLFASHATADNPRLKELFSRIPAVWVAEERISASCNITLELARALDSCTHLLVCWSQAAASSAVVLDELSAFYLRRPEPERILHLRLDDTPILTIFAARKYLWFRPNHSVDNVAGELAHWAAGRVGSWTASIVESAFNEPGPEALHQFPLGPAVKRHPAMDVITEELAKLLPTKVQAFRPITLAQAIRAHADPDIEEGRITMNLGLIPDIANGPLFFWSAVMDEARIKGPRMLAALLLTQDDMFFSARGRKARAELLILMRKM